MTRALALTLIFLLICGCATSKPPYVVEPTVLPPVRFSSQHPPTVRVRPANSEEAENIMQFPGKEEPESLVWTDTVGTLLLMPFIVVFLLPGAFAPGSKPTLKNDPGIRRALEEFPSRLREAIEHRFSVSSSGESSGLLDVVYFAGVSKIWSEADQECFVIHAQVTLQSKGEEVYKDIIRIDPRAYNSDLQKPDCSPSPDKILNYANEIVPKMIESRLPGLPWKSKRLRENDAPPDESLKRDGA
jgi:hypothetical protein